MSCACRNEFGLHKPHHVLMEMNVLYVIILALGIEH